MTVSANDVVRITAKLNYDGNSLQNVYHVTSYSGAGVSDDDFMDAADDWVDDAYDNIISVLHDGVDFDSIEFFNVTTNSPMGSRAWPTQTSGSDATYQALPLPDAGVMLFETPVARSLGRKFISGVTEIHQDDGGTMSVALKTALLAMAADLLTTFVVGTQTFEAGNWNEALSRFVGWVGAHLSTFYGTQRRRRKGRGE